jgi:hypothetical protein
MTKAQKKPSIRQIHLAEDEATADDDQHGYRQENGFKSTKPLHGRLSCRFPTFWRGRRQLSRRFDDDSVWKADIFTASKLMYWSPLFEKVEGEESGYSALITNLLRREAIKASKIS